MPMYGRQALEDKLKAHAARKFQQMETGLTNAALYVQAQSQKIVPVDYGILKASAFTRVERVGPFKSIVRTGYTAAYAVRVHEGQPHNAETGEEAAHGARFNAKYAAELAHAKALRKRKAGGTAGPFRHARGDNQQSKFLETPFRKAINDGTVLAFVEDEMDKP